MPRYYTSEKTMIVTLELTKKQACLVMEALDMYARLNMGQFEMIKELPTIAERIVGEDYDFAVPELTEARNLLFGMTMGINGSYGINSDYVHDDARLACDIKEVIRHEFWKQNPNRSSDTVDSTITFRSHSEPEKIKVRITN